MQTISKFVLYLLILYNLTLVTDEF